MTGFGSLSLGVKLGIVLGCLVVATLVAGGVKLYLNKRSLAKKLEEEAAKPADKENLVQKEYSEGNLFGVRAIEHGFYGGVAQSRPSSPSPSYLLAPGAPVVDWSKEGRGLNSSSSSISSFQQGPSGTRIKSSPLGLPASEAGIGGKYHPSTVGGIGGSYMPPLPSPRANRAESPMFGEQKPAGWVSPLDVHFSRPTTPQPYRPTSYLPRLNLDFEKSTSLMPTGSEIKSEDASTVNAEVAAPSPAVLKSQTVSEFSQPQSKLRAAQNSLANMFPMTAGTDELPLVSTPKGSRFENQPVPLKDLSPKPASVDPDKFPQDNRRWNPTSPAPRDSIMNRPVKTTSPTLNNNDSVPNERWVLSSPTVPQFAARDMEHSWVASSTSPTIPDRVLDAEWDRSKPIIRDSVVSKQRVSVHPPVQASLIEPRTNNRGSNINSIAASSRYSIETSILDVNTGGNAYHERMVSHTADFDFSHSRSHSGSSRGSIRQAGARDSVSHTRSMTEDSIIFNQQRTQNELQDTLNLAHPNHTVNFEDHQNHNSPFNNSNAASSHSQHSSSSSFSSYTSSNSKTTPEVPPLPPIFQKSQSSLPDLENFPFPATTKPVRPPRPRSSQINLNFAPPSFPGSNDRLSVNPNKDGRGRSTSEVSQNSIGDFYDSYYRQSGVPGHPQQQYRQQPQRFGGARSSVMAHVQGFNARSSRSGSIGGVRRPAPLNLMRQGGENNGVMKETMLEEGTPQTAAFGPESGMRIGVAATTERFPSRI